MKLEYFVSKLLMFVIVPLILASLIYGIASPILRSSEESDSLIYKNFSNAQTSSKASEIPKPIPISLRINTMFVGDVFWGRYVDDWSKKSELKFSYPFSGLSTFEREKYDAWIGGLECPITSTYLSSAIQDSQLKFSCPVEYTQEAAKWFNAFTLANNHTDNMQEVDGLRQTRDNLETNSIQYFGHFDNAIKDDICEVVSLPARLTFDNQGKIEVQKVNYPIAMCGFHNLYKLPTEEQMQMISLYSKHYFTIVMPHQGKEYTYKSDSLQQQYNRRYIDLGADAVIGNHVHSVQETEYYKGKLIVYSLGNFIFDQQAIPQVREGFGANLDMQYSYDENLQKFLDVSDSCKKFKDDCLKTAQGENLTKITPKIKYDIIPSDNSNKLTKKASPEVAAKIRKLTSWDKTAAELNK